MIMPYFYTYSCDFILYINYIYRCICEILIWTINLISRVLDLFVGKFSWILYLKFWYLVCIFVLCLIIGKFEFVISYDFKNSVIEFFGICFIIYNIRASRSLDQQEDLEKRRYCDQRLPNFEWRKDLN